MKKAIDFTIIMPVCHGGRFLRTALSSIHGLDYPADRMEVLVTGAEEDAVSRGIVRDEAVSSGYDIFHIPIARPSRAAMLNAACNVARGRVLVFADDDCVFLPDWLNRIEAALRQHTDIEIGILGGSDTHERDARPFNLALDYVFNSFIGTGGLRRGRGARVGKYYPKLWNMAVPRDIASQVALDASEGSPKIFDETLSVHEDVDLAERIEMKGRKIVFAPEVMVMHSRDTTLGSFIRRSFRMARIARSLGVHRLPHMLLMIFAVGLCALPLLSAVYQPMKMLLWIVLGAYLTVLLISAAGGLKQTGKLSVFAFVPLLLMSLHFARGFGFMFPWSRKHRQGDIL